MFLRFNGIDITELKDGYGFVYFETKEDAEDAIKEFDGIEFEGRQIRVEPARSGTSPFRIFRCCFSQFCVVCLNIILLLFFGCVSFVSSPIADDICYHFVIRFGSSLFFLNNVEIFSTSPTFHSIISFFSSSLLSPFSTSVNNLLPSVSL